MTFQIIVRMLPIRLKYHCKTIFEFDTQKYLFFHTYQLNKILKYIYIYISLYSYHFLSLFLKLQFTKNKYNDYAISINVSLLHNSLIKIMRYIFHKKIGQNNSHRAWNYNTSYVRL